MDKNRFKQLLESTIGNVKPLIMEQPQGGTNTGTSTGTENVNGNKLEVNKVYRGTGGDNAEGKILKVLSITPINGCDVKEVKLQQLNGPKYILYGYLEGTDVSPSDMMRTIGDGAKSQDPCKDLTKNENGYREMETFGHLDPYSGNF